MSLEESTRLRVEQYAAGRADRLDLDRLVHRSMLMDLATDILLVLDETGTVLDANQATVDIHGQSLDQLIGTNTFDFLHPDSHADFFAFADLIGDEDGVLQRRVKAIRGDGSIVHLDVKASWSAQSRRFYLVERDVSAEVARTTELQELSAQLAEQAHTDALTGLANRAAFDERISMPAAEDVHQWMVVVDVDQFKLVNDDHGHQAGDAVLRSVADRLAEYLRAEDFAARIGGDEFVAVLVSMRHDTGVGPRMEALQRLLSQPHRFGDRDIPATCSVGVAPALPGELGDTWYRRADTALYAAKGRGRNGIVILENG